MQAMSSRTSAGFTLLELVVVLIILSVVIAVVLPRLPLLQESNLRASARQTAALLRYLDERSVATKQSYRLRINLDEQRIDVLKRIITGEDIPVDDPFLQRQTLAGGVVISDLITERQGRITNGQVVIPYGPGGLVEPLLLHLSLANGSSSYTLQALPVSSTVRVFAGYQDTLQ